VALADAIAWAKNNGHVPASADVLIDSVAAVSVGITADGPVLDLNYVEDVAAETDMNIVATGRGLLVEVQGTAEGQPFSREELDALVDLGLAGISELTDIQHRVLSA
jgi:ribonuclease PH